MKILRQKNLEDKIIIMYGQYLWYEDFLFCKRFCCSVVLNVFLVYFINGFILKNGMYLYF